MMLKMLLVIIVLAGTMLALWRGWLGFAVPVMALWLYSYLTGFSQLTVLFLIVFTGLTGLVQTVAGILSDRYRDGNMAYTGAGITGFATGLLVCMLFGTFWGFFAWWDMIGQVTVRPLSLGIKPLVKSFAGGTVKVIYGLVITGVVAFRLI